MLSSIARFVYFIHDMWYVIMYLDITFHLPRTEVIWHPLPMLAVWPTNSSAELCFWSILIISWLYEMQSQMIKSLSASTSHSYSTCEALFYLSWGRTFPVPSLNRCPVNLSWFIFSSSCLPPVILFKGLPETNVKSRTV
jgi:hypothetical protein